MQPQKWKGGCQKAIFKEGKLVEKAENWTENQERGTTVS